MTRVLITIDTELSAGLHQQGVSLTDNIAASIDARTAQGDYGVGWMIDRFDAHGLTGVFFVDPMPALVYGPGFLADIVGAIVARGHEVELHIHTEWLAWAKRSPVAAGVRPNIGDYRLDDQRALLDLARGLLINAGAPPPSAFRAGNFGANDDTLRALAQLGIAYDSSFNAAMADTVCAIDLPADAIEPVARQGLVVAPVASLRDIGDGMRPAQICALSAREMRELLRHAARERLSAQVIVTHSFELLDRRRTRPNRLTIRRFEAMCAEIARNPALKSCGFRDFGAAAIVAEASGAAPLAADRLRSLARMAEQLGSNLVYERGLAGG
ncbi:MAG: hypothetical protein GW859_04945 [Sphingomonadales bacterium]|nr:hypothetical protein [Sphingomonadales bacterium]